MNPTFRDYALLRYASVISHAPYATVEARVQLRLARKMAQRMECRLLDYRRAIEVLGFRRDKNIENKAARERNG